MPTAYDYLTFTLERGLAAWAGFARHVRDDLTLAVAQAGGKLSGLFQGQLGFASNEAVVLIRWPGAARNASLELDRLPGVAGVQREKLTPTARPLDGATLRPGGIYVHRWFTVDAESVDEFIELSTRAWVKFEDSYESEIFGLFTAERTAEDVRQGVGRLLLLTYYASHDVWEKSRLQTNDPDGLFVKRHALTRTTIGRSSILL